MKNDEISLKEAAEYLPKPHSIVSVPGKIVPLPDDEVDPTAKREREVGNAGATLEAMLAAGRAGKTVRGQK